GLNAVGPTLMACPSLHTLSTVHQSKKNAISQIWDTSAVIVLACCDARRTYGGEQRNPGRSDIVRRSRLTRRSTRAGPRAATHAHDGRPPHTDRKNRRAAP